MASWTVLEKLPGNILKFASPFGHLYHATLFFGRYLPLVVGKDIVTDEQKHWKCDTSQPGCSEICFSRFAPIALSRFWYFQVNPV